MDFGIQHAGKVPTLLAAAAIDGRAWNCLRAAVAADAGGGRATELVAGRAIERRRQSA